jgi:hypothetical protein
MIFLARVLLIARRRRLYARLSRFTVPAAGCYGAGFASILDARD